MKGNPQMIETLNTLLAEELTAISEYMRSRRDVRAVGVREAPQGHRETGV